MSSKKKIKEFWQGVVYENEKRKEIASVMREIRKSEVHLDQIKGSLIGGAAGDALGYAVEFMSEDEIFSRYGKKGIQKYEIDHLSGKAQISDDTQMTLFTANGILTAHTRSQTHGIGDVPSAHVQRSYQDWLRTQEMTYEESKKASRGWSWLLEVPELYARRAPGNTCLSALVRQRAGSRFRGDFIDNPLNKSKGCGGIMRVAPLALKEYPHVRIEYIDRQAAEIAAITHGHSLGYMPAAVLVHIISRIVYPKKEQTLKEIVLEARDTIAELFEGDKHLKELTSIIDRAIKLSENRDRDLVNIHRLGEGWVAEETLAIAIYCSLRYQNDFSAGIIAAVNHKGDSDSTGAVTGNILGALIGYEAIEPKWKTNLELKDVILEMATDLCHGCQMNEFGHYEDPNWTRKYIDMQWKKPGIQ